MAQKNVIQLNETGTTDGSYFEITIPDGIGGWLSRRIAFADLKSAVTTSPPSIRAASSVALVEGENTVTFQQSGSPAPFDSDEYTLIVHETTGMGYDLVSQNENGFVVDSLGVGSINYIATLNT